MYRPFLSLLILAVISLKSLLVHSYQPTFQQISNSTFAKPYRGVTAIDPTGSMVELDDRSCWIVKGWICQHAARQWVPGDVVVIYPVFSTFISKTRFYLYNERTASRADAELSLGPVLNSPCTTQICFIEQDYTRILTGHLQLCDGQGYISRWSVDPQDFQEFCRWREGEAVIIGSNDSFPSNVQSNGDYILINVERNRYVRANSCLLKMLCIKAAEVSFFYFFLNRCDEK